MCVSIERDRERGRGEREDAYAHKGERKILTSKGKEQRKMNGSFRS